MSLQLSNNHAKCVILGISILHEQTDEIKTANSIISVEMFDQTATHNLDILFLKNYFNLQLTVGI
jgi:hypothetical protein